MLRRGFVAGAVAWAAALPLATLVASQPHPAVASYLFGVIVYAVGAVVCHQLDGRSFHLWAHQMPVCARCTGIYAGAALGAVAAMAAQATQPRLAARWILAIAALPMAASLAYEWTTGAAPSNVVRAATGIVLGATAAWLVVTAWRAPRMRAPM